MAVLVEAITVVIRRDALDAKYPGGFTAFQQQAPFLASRDTLVTDGELVGISFMSPVDVRGFCDDMGRLGFSSPGEPVDLVVVDQHSGPTVPCEWIEGRSIVFEDGGEVTAARLVGGKVATLFVPEEWSYADSLTVHHEYVPLDQVGERFAFVRGDGALELWRDKATGEERHIERPVSADDGYAIPKALA
jgi:hypothetical protein